MAKIYSFSEALTVKMHGRDILKKQKLYDVWGYLNGRKIGCNTYAWNEKVLEWHPDLEITEVNLVGYKTK
jgi:hypothetical protein